MKLLAGRSTPTFIYHTKKGSVYQLIADHLHQSSANSFEISFGHFKEEAGKFIEAKMPIAFKDFLGFEEKVNLVLNPYDVQDIESIKGCSGDDSIRIKGEGGYSFRTNTAFLDFAKLVEPEVLISLFEPLTKDSGKKGISRAIAKTRKFFEETLKRKFSSEHLFPVLVNPKLHLIKEQAKYASTLVGIQGLAVCGFEHLSESEKLLVISEIKSGCEESFEDLVILSNSESKLPDILNGLQMGLDCFVVNEPFSLAAHGKAFVQKKSEEIRLEHEILPKEINSIDLSEDVFKEDSSAIEDACLCYSCKNHTKAYIHHLLSCSEMTGNVLLTIHNLHAFENILKELRESENLVETVNSLFSRVLK